MFMDLLEKVIENSKKICITFFIVIISLFIYSFITHDSLKSIFNFFINTTNIIFTGIVTVIKENFFELILSLLSSI